MKAVLMDMRDISLSKAVSDKKPKRFFAFFIYVLLGLVITALGWAYFGYLDIVVRAQGIIRPLGQTVEVFNTTHGEVREVFFYDGMQVARGEILYMLDTFQLENERDLLQEQVDNLSFEYASLRLYLESIEAGENLIGSFNYEFGARLDSFLVSLLAIDHDIATQSVFLQEETLGLANALEYTQFELRVLRTFEQSILDEQDLFGAIPGSGLRREIFNTYRNQFHHYVLEMDNLLLQQETLQASLDGNIAVRYMAQGGVPSTYVHIVYRNMYDEYTMGLNQLTAVYDLAREDYEIYISLYDADIITQVELQNTEIRLEAAEAAVLEHTTLFLTRIENEIRNAETRLANVEIQIESLRVGTLTTISSQRLILESAVLEMNQGLTSAQLQQGALFLVGEETGDAVLLRLNEVNRTLAQISIAEQEIMQLNAALASINNRIDDSIVRTPVDGEIVTHVELADGSLLMGGVHVMSIVPLRGDTLNTHIFINNNDIGNIEEGMTVRYDIPALPHRDFGDINGVITRISTDIIMEGGAHGFFQVEAEIEDRMYYDTQGNGMELRVGMGFEARIVVERQRILFYLLDRLNLRLS